MYRIFVICGNAVKHDMLDGDIYIERVDYEEPTRIAQFRPSTGQVW